MKKEAKLLRCTLLNGSAWSTERKYMRRYRGKCDIFFGIEHRLRKEEMEEQFNKKAKEECHRMRRESQTKQRKHTPGVVFVAVGAKVFQSVDRGEVGAEDK